MKSVQEIGPIEFPCANCGQMVDLTRTVKFTQQNKSGAFSTVRMPEHAVRSRIAAAGVPLPPILCSNEEKQEITTERL